MAIDLMNQLSSYEVDFGSIDEKTSMLSLTNDDFFSNKTTLKTFIAQISNNARLVNEHTNQYKIAASKSEYDNIQNKMNNVITNNSNLTLTIRSLRMNYHLSKKNLKNCCFWSVFLLF